MTITNHDAWCIDWYRRLIQDGTAEDSQRIAVEMHDQLLAVEKERDAAIADIETMLITPNANNGFICDFCKPEQYCLEIGCVPKWRGRTTGKD